MTTLRPKRIRSVDIDGDAVIRIEARALIRRRVARRAQPVWSAAEYGDPVPAGSPGPIVFIRLCWPSVRNKDERGGRWPTVGSRTEPGTPAAEHLGFAGEVPRLARRAESLAREVPRLVRKALSFACKPKSLAAGALSLGRELSAPARRRVYY
jgi:hypothetical protein